MIPNNFLLSDLLKHNVRCDFGKEHGLGSMAWMHPPVHRLLGWVSRKSANLINSEVWRLDQCCGFSDNEVFVRGNPVVTDIDTLIKLPTLIESELLGRSGIRLGSLVDLAFELKTGNILHYLVSRTDSRFPVTSQWRLSPNRILDQGSSYVRTSILSLDDLPLARASVRYELMQRTQRWRDNLRQMSNLASDRLEGWLDENEQSSNYVTDRNSAKQEVWDDEDWAEDSTTKFKNRNRDPWI